MGFISLISFAILINGVATPFFHAERGLRQGFLLSPLLFILVAEGLSRAISHAKARGYFLGIKIVNNLNLTHTLFVEDILIFCGRKEKDAESLANILELFKATTSMQINLQKSTLSLNRLTNKEVAVYRSFFPFYTIDFDEGLKYLGFYLKANCYRKEDWKLLIGNLEKRVKVWSYRWISRAG
jgi:hypothetical protein